MSLYSKGETQEVIEKVLENFREKGIRDIEDARELTKWLEELSAEGLKIMYETDKATTLKMLVDCFGVEKGIEKYVETSGNVNQCKKILNDRGYVILYKKEFECDIAEKREKIRYMENEVDKLLGTVAEFHKKNERLKKEVSALKNALFDEYIKTGKIILPELERRNGSNE